MPTRYPHDWKQKAMRIKDLTEGLPVRPARGSGDLDVAVIVEDSRMASPGCLFIARPGTETDGRRFAADAVANGAVAVVTDDPSCVPASAAALVADYVPIAAALLAERFFGHPSRRLKLVGVTGTNGKTTIVHLVHQILNRVGIKTGLMGTIHTDDGRGLHPSMLTTPPAIEISRTMARMVKNGCQACVMEASSHALEQSRTSGLEFDGGVFSNLSGDHLDYHRTMDDYARAKSRLFAALPASGWAVVNGDDAASDIMIGRCDCPVTITSMIDARAVCYARVRSFSINATQVEMTGPWGRLDIALPLVGEHNVANAIQAAAVCSRLGLDGEALLVGLSECTAPPGRLELVMGGDAPFSVLVDYAHTDAALENVLRALRPVLPEGGRLRVVFGCGGDRDRTKRPRMATVACEWADDVIITSDNPRSEDPQSIVDEAAAGVPAGSNGMVKCCVDRAEAIKLAIERGGDGDIVLIAGKGHENYQIVGAERRHFDDREVAAEALAGRKVLFAGR